MWICTNIKCVNVIMPHCWFSGSIEDKTISIEIYNLKTKEILNIFNTDVPKYSIIGVLEEDNCLFVPVISKDDWKICNILDYLGREENLCSDFSKPAMYNWSYKKDKGMFYNKSTYAYVSILRFIRENKNYEIQGDILSIYCNDNIMMKNFEYIYNFKILDIGVFTKILLMGDD